MTLAWPGGSDPRQEDQGNGDRCRRGGRVRRAQVLGGEAGEPLCRVLLASAVVISCSVVSIFAVSVTVCCCCVRRFFLQCCFDLPWCLSLLPLCPSCVVFFALAHRNHQTVNIRSARRPPPPLPVHSTRPSSPPDGSFSFSFFLAPFLALSVPHRRPRNFDRALSGRNKSGRNVQRS